MVHSINHKQKQNLTLKMGDQQNKHAIFLLCCCIQLISASAFGSTRNESHEEVKSSGKPDDIYFADSSSFYASPRFMELTDGVLGGPDKPWGKVLGGTILINMITLVGVVFLVPAFSRQMMHKISAAFFWRADKEAHAHAHIIHVCSEEQAVEDGGYVEGHSKMLDIFIPSFAAGALFATVVFLVIPESIMLLNAGVATHDEDAPAEEGDDHDEELAELATGAIWRFGTGILSGFLLPVALGAIFPRSVEHECNDDCGPSELNDLMSKCMIKTDGCNACAKVEQDQRDDADVESK